ncbi:hypothetical protein OG884_18830 [Streptosporangium sp. NBC_01755]|uniref:hypothetical protein n=1 Tax=Streptosporangium sp. NBC_01755 TaxID=2975949 RepID=UPI002DDBA329|nr:hypothetical protein [Streptosporangium sp. NBC_01755]WSD03864.1 hypothetical protein OG884_18830 [Streptosporangium sp. NBC_01755]
MATYSAQAITADGLVATSRNAASGDKITPDNNLFIRATNASGAEVDLTIPAYGNTRYGAANAAKVITIAAAATKVIPLGYPEYINPADGLIALSWESTASVTFTVERL